MLEKQKLQQVSGKYKPIKLTFGDGINTFLTPFEIKNSESPDSSNVSSMHYPALSTRTGVFRSVPLKLTAPNGVAVIGGKFHAVDSKTWVWYDSGFYVDLQALAGSDKGKFIEFNTGSLTYAIYSNGVDRFSYDGTTVVDLTTAPLTSLFACANGRLFWAKGNVITFSALNAVNDYTTVSGGGTINLTTSDEITAITNFDNRIIIWSANSMYILYGTSALDFDLKELNGGVGCISDSSITKCANNLYWVSPDGVYEYNGSLPLKISWNIDNVEWSYLLSVWALNVEASTLGNRLVLISLDNYGTYEYDTVLKKWYKRLEAYTLFAKDLSQSNDFVYGVDEDGNVHQLYSYGFYDNDTHMPTELTWYYITKSFNNNGKTAISKLFVVVDMPTYSTFKIEYSKTSNKNDFVLLHTFTASANIQFQEIDIPVNLLYNLDTYRFKFSGTGPLTLHYMEKTIRVIGR